MINIKYQKGFTLLELLIVIGILATLTTVVVLTINPAEYLKQARDTKRVVDLSNINKAVQLFDFDNIGIISTTSSTIVYVSIPDTSSTCGNLGLPTLPSGYTYHCVTSDYLNKINGTGWIPLDLTKISGGSPLSSLPVDPINTTSTRNYYTYMQGGSFELAASFESASYKQGGEKDKTSTDKGAYTDLYEVGTNTALLPIDYGDSSLVGYWNFENNVNDYSGNGNSGAWYGTSTSRYVTGKVGTSAGYFNGRNDYIDVGNKASLDITDAITIGAWVNLSGTNTDYNNIFQKLNGFVNYFAIRYSDGFVIWYIPGVYNITTAQYSELKSGWNHILVTYNKDAGSNNMKLYINGVQRFQVTKTGAMSTSSNNLLMSGGYRFGGQMDDVRLYNRALSASEISAIYNATK